MKGCWAARSTARCPRRRRSRFRRPRRAADRGSGRVGRGSDSFLFHGWLTGDRRGHPQAGQGFVGKPIRDEEAHVAPLGGGVAEFRVGHRILADEVLGIAVKAQAVNRAAGTTFGRRQRAARHTRQRHEVGARLQPAGHGGQRALCEGRGRGEQADGGGKPGGCAKAGRLAFGIRGAFCVAHIHSPRVIRCQDRRRKNSGYGWKASCQAHCPSHPPESDRSGNSSRCCIRSCRCRVAPRRRTEGDRSRCPVEFGTAMVAWLNTALVERTGFASASSIATSAAWKACSWLCVLRTMRSSIVDVKTPDTARIVRTTSRMRPMTRAAPCCRRGPSDLPFIAVYS